MWLRKNLPQTSLSGTFPRQPAYLSARSSCAPGPGCNMDVKVLMPPEATRFFSCDVRVQHKTFQKLSRLSGCFCECSCELLQLLYNLFLYSEGKPWHCWRALPRHVCSLCPALQSPTHAMLPFEVVSTQFFVRPHCDSAPRTVWLGKQPSKTHCCRQPCLPICGKIGYSCAAGSKDAFAWPRKKNSAGMSFLDCRFSVCQESEISVDQHPCFLRASGPGWESILCSAVEKKSPGNHRLRTSFQLCCHSQCVRSLLIDLNTSPCQWLHHHRPLYLCRVCKGKASHEVAALPGFHKCQCHLESLTPDFWSRGMKTT